MRFLGIVFLLMLSFSSLAFATSEKETLTTVYQATQSNYIDPVKVGKVAALALKELKNLDPKITIADEGNRVVLYYNVKQVKSYPKPGEKDIQSWVNLTFIILREVKKLSPTIKAQEHDVFDALMTGAFKSLNNDSKYYKYADDEEDVSYKDRRVDDVLYVKIGKFNHNSKENLIASINRSKNKFDGLIIDLRGNRGGVLAQAIDITDLFLDEGIITSTYGHEGEDMKFYTSSAGDFIKGKPIVVLVDGESASASEVLASSMQDQGRAKIVGSTTFGKGTVQTLLELPNDSYLAITNAKFYTPSGKIIDKKGIIPDICTVDDTAVDMSKVEKDINECPRQSRVDNDFDIKTAVKLIKESY